MGGRGRKATDAFHVLQWCILPDGWVAIYSVYVSSIGGGLACCRQPLERGKCFAGRGGRMVGRTVKQAVGCEDEGLVGLVPDWPGWHEVKGQSAGKDQAG